MPNPLPPSDNAHSLAQPNVIRRLYDWVLMWSAHPHAGIALFFIAFAEATFFPIPPDILLLAMAMAAPKRAFVFAAICTAGSVLGGLVGYAMGWGLWNSLDTFFYHYIPGISEQSFQTMAAKFSDNTFLTIFTAGFTPIPFKIFTIAAGAAAVPLLAFMTGALISRALRFFLLAGLIWWMGPAVKHWIDRYFNQLTLAFTAVLIIAMVLFQYLHH